MQPIYLCPICQQIMQPVAACKLQCACGYRETCSDLFPADRIVQSRDDAHAQSARRRTPKRRECHEHP